MKQSQKEYKRIVVKIGSSLFFPKWGEVDMGLLNSIVSQVAQLAASGKEVAIVASGAIALGMHELGYRERPKKLEILQSMSAIGQTKLMDTYRSCFSDKGLHCAQILLTREDLDDRQRYLNAKNTLLALLSMRCVIPIINENDTISTDEIKFGDNDSLSALVATLINADLLIMLSDVDGLLDREKNVIRIVDEITAQIKGLAAPSEKKTSVGGMITKIQAARIAMDSGISCVIANGHREDIIPSIVREPQRNGTLFISKECLDAKESWLAFSAKPKGRIIVDDGAKLALVNKKSLLSVGVVSSEGAFNTGDIVSLKGKDGAEFARGKARISSKELEKVAGRRSEKEVIHRDDIVIL